MNVNLGTVIASRTVKWRPEEGTNADVSIVVGTPQDASEFAGVLVPFQIIGLGRDRVRFAVGVDGIQAFLLALRMIRADLERLQLDLNGRLVWLDDDSGSCGLDVSPLQGRTDDASA